MRSTRNTSKTPPAAKKSGKGTPGGKGTSKKDDTQTAVPEPASAFDVEVVKATEPSDVKEEAEKAPKQSDIKEELVGGAEVSKEETADASDAMADTSKEMEPSKAEPIPNQKPDELLEKKVAIGEVNLPAPQQVEPAAEEASATDVKMSIELAEDGGDEKSSQEGKDEEQGDGEDNTEEKLDHVENDDVNGEDNDEEEDDGEDDGADDEEENDDDVAEEMPVTERQKRKKLEVFVGGLHKEATVEDVEKTFETVGEVVEVRMMTHPQTGKNKGYAFVRYATVDQAIKAATELDRIKIRDRECAVVPSEDNDTLFVGNVCKSWKSEQVFEKLKEYGVEGIDEMILVEDLDNEGQNRGHAFLEFATHNDAVKAFKRLSKPDAIFGCDRSARIGWAEGSNEPDEAVMAKVKSIFINGLPAEWDEAKIKEHFGKHGTIDRIVLSKNISRSKRTDYAFVHFSTRDAAAAAIEALNEVELVDGDKKVTLKVELSKPAPRRRMKGHRGSFPVGGRPSKQKKHKDGGQSDRRKGEGGSAMSRGGQGARGSSQKYAKGLKRKGADERPLPEERLRDKRNRGLKFPKAGSAVPKGGRVGSSSRRERPSGHSEDDYVPLGARISPSYGPVRGYSGRSSREVAYSQRGHAYAGLRPKRSYSAMDEETAYYDSAHLGYPRARMEYAEPALYPDSVRAVPSGHTLPPVRGSHGYSSVFQGAADDYTGYLPAAADPRGASYASTYYGSRAGSGYNSFAGSSGPYH